MLFFIFLFFYFFFFFQAEDGIRDAQESRGLGDVYKRQALTPITHTTTGATGINQDGVPGANGLPAGVSAHWAANTITISGTPTVAGTFNYSCLLYTSDAADDLLCVDLGGRRIIKKKNKNKKDN